jgi:hypothetical protein
MSATSQPLSVMLHRYLPQAPSAVSGSCGSSSNNSSDGSMEFGVIAALPTQNRSQVTLRWLGF